MNTQDVIKYFGSQSEVARVLKITRSAVNKWPDIVPEGKAYRLQAITSGALRVKTEVYENATMEKAAL